MTLDLQRATGSCRVRVMPRWRADELHQGLKELLRRIDDEREQLAGFTKRDLADSVGLSWRQYHRYMRGEHLPVDDAGVERIMQMAEQVGIPRKEAEGYLPQPLPPAPVPLRSNALLPLSEVTHRLDEVLAAIRENRAVLEQILEKL